MNTGPIMFAIVVAMLSFVAGAEIAETAMQDAAIKRGFGLYCPTTGNFAFKDECK